MTKSYVEKIKKKNKPANIPTVPITALTHIIKNYSMTQQVFTGNDESNNNNNNI